MTDDLVNRLRDRRFDGQLAMRASAADRIEQLEARVGLVESYLRGALDTVEAFSYADTSEARATLEKKHD